MKLHGSGFVQKGPGGWAEAGVVRVKPLSPRSWFSPSRHLPHAHLSPPPCTLPPPPPTLLSVSLPRNQHLGTRLKCPSQQTLKVSTVPAAAPPQGCASGSLRLAETTWPESGSPAPTQWPPVLLGELWRLGNLQRAVNH